MARRIGRHHYVLVDDENPENRQIRHLECRASPKIKKDGSDYTPTDGG